MKIANFMKTIKNITLLVCILSGLVSILPVEVFAKKPIGPYPKPWVLNNKPQYKRQVKSNYDLQKLRQMRAVMALKKTADGGVCQVDVRGRSSLTPNFVKSASRYASTLKNKLASCNPQETKAFKTTAKNAQLTGGHVKKVILGSALGGLAKAAGVGCVIGSGIAATANFLSSLFKDDAQNTKTQATAPCIECKFKKSKELQEIETLSGLGVVATGFSAGASIAVSDEKKKISNPVKADLQKLSVKLQTDLQRLSVNLEADKTMKSLNQANISYRLAKIKKMIEVSDQQLSVVRKSYHTHQEKLRALQNKGFVTFDKETGRFKRTIKARGSIMRPTVRAEISLYNKTHKQVVSALNNLEGALQSQKRWEQIQQLKLSEKSGSASKLEVASKIQKLVQEDIRQRVSTYSPEKVLNTIPRDQLKAYEAKLPSEIKLKVSSFTKSIIGGGLSGVFGFLVCEDGTTYLLSDDKKTDI